MRRVLLVGRGPLPAPGVHSVGFSQLRTLHLWRALEQAGHAVRLVLLDQTSDPRPASGAPWTGTWRVAEEGPDWIDRASWLKGDGAEVIVSAGPYNPARLACLIAEQEPVWADVPGDPFSELEALCQALGKLPAQRVAAAFAAAEPVFARADALSTVSEAQRFAAIGQLGLLGRVQGARPRVWSIPIAHWFPFPTSPARSRAPGSPLVIALSGAFNPWFDQRTVIAGLSQALDQISGLRLICTGGAVRGLYEEGHAEFLSWARASAHHSRIQVRGWVPQGSLKAALAEAHLGLSMDRPGWEPELGSRTRVLFFSWLGMEVLATPRSELVRDLVDAGLAHGLQPGDPDDLARVLSQISADGCSAERTAAAHRHLAARYDPQAIAAPLLDFIQSPWRSPPGLKPGTQLGVEVARLRQQLAAIHSTPTWRALSRVHRLGQQLRDLWRTSD